MLRISVRSSSVCCHGCPWGRFDWHARESTVPSHLAARSRCTSGSCCIFDLLAWLHTSLRISLGIAGSSCPMLYCCLWRIVLLSVVVECGYFYYNRFCAILLPFSSLCPRCIVLLHTIAAGIDSGLLYSWVRCYKMKGYQGLVAQRQGRPPKEPDMKKKIEPAELAPSEREEMVRLRAENERLRAEIAVVKKRLPWEKRDAQRNSRRKSCAHQRAAWRKIQTKWFAGCNRIVSTNMLLRTRQNG